MQVKNIIGTITIAGASVLVVNSVLQLTKATKLSDILFPSIGVLVGASAISYSLNDMNSATLAKKQKESFTK
jgi:hypothetical protein